MPRAVLDEEGPKVHEVLPVEAGPSRWRGPRGRARHQPTVPIGMEVDSPTIDLTYLQEP
uniref:Uncharacterized protein n=1 Tax=Arundo donax TaxID=35708 RepID=A0A0A8Y9M4_ARUDO